MHENKSAIFALSPARKTNFIEPIENSFYGGTKTIEINIGHGDGFFAGSGMNTELQYLRWASKEKNYLESTCKRT